MANCLVMTQNELAILTTELRNAKSTLEKISILNRCAAVSKIDETASILRTFLQSLTPECECAIKQLAAIGQVVDWTVDSAERWRELLQVLLPIDSFYREMGGIVGYHAEILRLLQAQESESAAVRYHSPLFDDISEETPEVLEAIYQGLCSLPQLSELYPLGGAADRLHLVDEATGSELPAAKLQFCGRTLLASLIRDLAAREWLYFRLFGRQLTTPIGIMTSKEKENFRHVLEICEKHEWFGRPKDSFRLFVQPLVPTVDDRGNWHTAGPLKLHLKPGGHGAIWKLAKDEGVFRWLRSLGRTKALVRQINNPAAGIDYGLLAFAGIGARKGASFGFASCPRLVKSAEGMNVLIEKENGEIGITNIEYCDFAKWGIEDLPIKEGAPFSRFSSNTNILFVDLHQVEEAVERCPFPGLLINLKKAQLVHESGEKKEVPVARLESTMQNLADVFTEEKAELLHPRKTFVTYNQRSKTISVAKKAYVPGKPLLETTEQCFFEMMQESAALLSSCGFELPSPVSIDRFLQEGPSFVFASHPALGPLYSIIRQKLRRGKISSGSEWNLEIAEADIEELDLSGSFRIVASHPMGSPDAQGLTRYSPLCARVKMRRVQIRNRGVDWAKSAPFWKMEYKRKESVLIEIKGNGEFVAEDLSLEGSHHFVVEDGQRLELSMSGGAVSSAVYPASPNPLWNYSWDQGVRLERP